MCLWRRACYALDMSTVEPSRKRKLPAASAGAEKKEKKPCKLEWRGAACCNGLHFYRNGPGHKGGAYWQCGVTTCRKILPPISAEQQKEARLRLAAYKKCVFTQGEAEATDLWEALLTGEDSNPL